MTNKSGWGGTRVERLRILFAHRLRAAWATQCQVLCPRCNEPILPGQPWDIGHTYPVSTHPHLMWTPAHLHIEHARCNRADGAAMTNALVRRRRQQLWKW